MQREMEQPSAAAPATGRPCLRSLVPGFGLEGRRPAGGSAPSGKARFQRGLPGGAVCTDPLAHKLAAKVARLGGWTVLMTINAAWQEGKVQRPEKVQQAGEAEGRPRLADGVARLLARGVLWMASVAEVVRWNGRPGWA
jgi:hypothetical protein